MLESLSLLDDESTRKRRKPKERMDWSERVSSLEDWEFRRTYRMTQATFDHVLQQIRPHLFKDEEKARRVAENGGYHFIEPELRLSMTLRFLAGATA